MTTVTSGRDEYNNQVDWVKETVKSLETGEVIEVRKKVNLVDAKTGEKVQTELIKDAKGNIVKAAVSADAESITKEVNKKKASTSFWTPNVITWSDHIFVT